LPSSWHVVILAGVLLSFVANVVVGIRLLRKAGAA